MKKELIAIYKEAFEKGELPTDGLCGTLSIQKLSKENINLFCPTEAEIDELGAQGRSSAFWGCESLLDETSIYQRARTFTTLRQTILGFLIAMEK